MATPAMDPSAAVTPTENPVGLKGLAFIEWSDDSPARLSELFRTLGLSQLMASPDLQISLFKQNNIHFILNHASGRFAQTFREAHGPSVCGLGFLVENAREAHGIAVERGAVDFDGHADLPFPAVYGVGGSLIYFVDRETPYALEMNAGFRPLPSPEIAEEKGFLTIDHLTNNVFKGTMAEWSHFYKHVFGFTEIRYFDIRGQQTGLNSFALQSPCNTFAIPINEGTETKSQIEEYLREYRGAGVQHIALLTDNLLEALDRMQGSGLQTLDIDPDYYQTVFQRVPNVTEDHARIQEHKVLVDGDAEGYLLQIFTQNVVGPIFFEFIQRKNHFSFGEGNFGALFRAIERDQQRRGTL